MTKYFPILFFVQLLSFSACSPIKQNISSIEDNAVSCVKIDSITNFAFDSDLNSFIKNTNYWYKYDSLNRLEQENYFLYETSGISKWNYISNKTYVNDGIVIEIMKYYKDDNLSQINKFKCDKFSNYISYHEEHFNSNTDGVRFNDSTLINYTNNNLPLEIIQYRTRKGEPQQTKIDYNYIDSKLITKITSSQHPKYPSVDSLIFYYHDDEEYPYKIRRREFQASYGLEINKDGFLLKYEQLSGSEKGHKHLTTYNEFNQPQLILKSMGYWSNTINFYYNNYSSLDSIVKLDEKNRKTKMHFKYSSFDRIDINLPSMDNYLGNFYSSTEYLNFHLGLTYFECTKKQDNLFTLIPDEIDYYSDDRAGLLKLDKIVKIYKSSCSD